MLLLSSVPMMWLILWAVGSAQEPSTGDDGAGPDQDVYAAARERMVAEQIESRGVSSPAVLAAMRQVPRHLFVSTSQWGQAYDDHPLPIGHDQTISQPYIVALMTEIVRPHPGDRALEIGTGSGYQAAVLARVVRHVYTIEIVEALARQARERLARLGYSNVTVRTGDGYEGWAAESPFDIIVVTAAPEKVPQALIDQLKPGGRLVIPVGPLVAQELQVIEKGADGRISTTDVAAVRFVPMVKR
jgi:protein-L-isoaspartate(D-aspartate) O-methyltransferase